MGVILILGRTEDLCCQRVQEQLSSAGREVWFLPETQLLPNLRFAWTISRAGRHGVIGLDNLKVDFADISGVLYRFYGFPLQAEEFYTPDGQYISSEWNALFMAWLDWMDCKVVNRLRPELWYKPYLNVPDLVSLTPFIRLKLPRALVTTSGDEARAFCASVFGPVRYSPLTQPSRYRIHTAEDKQRLVMLEGSLPFYLTQWIEGVAIDAFVIGREVVFVDDNGQIVNEEGSGGVKESCAALGTALGIEFYRLPLVKTAQGDWYCLGLDRVPQLYGCAAEAQIEIARNLVGLLSDNAGFV
jgi:hypothetical protein